MGAHLLCLEEIDSLSFLMDLEIPNSENGFSQAVNWLIGLNLSEGI